MDLVYPDGVVLHGDCRARLAELPAESVQCCVTSPPYYGLRRYAGLPDSVWGGDPDCDHSWGSELPGDNRGGSGTPNGRNNRGEDYGRDDPRGRYCRHCNAWLGCLGNEPTVQDFLAHLVKVFRAVRRVLRRDGVCWVNLGDSYVSNPAYCEQKPKTTGPLAGADLTGHYQSSTLDKTLSGIKAKNLLLVPERFAIAMQADGWYVRSRIVWAKKSAMPESLTDRPTSAHETIWLLTKEARYFYDSEAVRVPHVEPGRIQKNYGNGYTASDGEMRDFGKKVFRPAEESPGYNPNGANLRNTWLDVDDRADLSDLWELGPAPFSGQHFATYPPKIVQRAILASTSEKGACASCGAPWRRVTETSGGTIGRSWHNHVTDEYLGNRAENAAKGGHGYQRISVGWQASCSCNAPTVPQTVLDPFLGSGTTAAVARSLGRRFVGVEGSAEYVELSRKRIESTTLALAEEEAAIDAPAQLALEAFG